MTHQDTDQDTPYHGIAKPAFEKDPWDHDYYDLIDKIDDELILKDTAANRPSSPPNGSWFLATDEDILYFYDSSWRVIAGSDIQSSSDINHNDTQGGTSGNPHADSASESYVDTAESDANTYTDVKVENHRANEVHDSAQPNQTHGNEDHDSTFAVDGDAQPPEDHGDGAHSPEYVDDGDGTKRQIWVIANGASDPAGASANDIIFERE